MLKFFYYCLLFFGATYICSCNKTDNTFGSQYLSNDATQIIRTDSFSVDLKTTYTDSFPSSAKGITMIGSYTDPYFGKIAAQTFCELSAPTYSDIFSNTTYDSVTLLLNVKKGNFYGDSTKTLHIDVNQLTENIDIPVTQGYLYNVDTFQYNAKPIGSKDIVVRPNAIDTIPIKLSDAVGKQLFGMLQRGSDTIKQSSIFLDFFKGLRIGSNGTNSIILNCTDSIKLRVHYRKSDIYVSNQIAAFPLSNSSHHFFNVKADRTGTPIAGLGTSFKEVHSRLTKNAGYTQTATGVTAKITFPSIRDVLKLPNYVKVVKALLYIKPLKTTYETIYPLPQYLRLSTTTILNYLGTDLYALTSSGTPAIQYGNLAIDYINGENTTYSYDVTTYIKTLVNDATLTANDGLLIAPPSPSYESIFNRVVIGNSTGNANASLNLQIFYVTIQL